MGVNDPSMDPSLFFYLLYPAGGLVAGILAGLLGVGGGVVIIPIMTSLFSRQGVSPACMLHLALGTSLATILVTSASSLRAHHRAGAVRWDIVWAIAPGIVAGTLAGSRLAAGLSTGVLRVVFSFFLLYVAVQMVRPARTGRRRPLPGKIGLSAVGGLIGALSSLVGIGGGTLSVPFLSRVGLGVHAAIGTSAAIGFPIAAAGTLGYVINGWGVEGLPHGSAGFVYLPAFFGIASVSLFTAPIGARLAHRLPVSTLKRVFGLFLLGVAARMVGG